MCISVFFLQGGWTVNGSNNRTTFNPGNALQLLNNIWWRRKKVIRNIIHAPYEMWLSLCSFLSSTYTRLISIIKKNAWFFFFLTWFVVIQRLLANNCCCCYKSFIRHCYSTFSHSFNFIDIVVVILYSREKINCALILFAKAFCKVTKVPCTKGEGRGGGLINTNWYILILTYGCVQHMYTQQNDTSHTFTYLLKKYKQ